MRTCISAAVVLAIGWSVSVTTSAQQVSGPDAVLVHPEGEVYVNDRVVAADSAPVALLGPARVRTSQGRAVIAFERSSLLFLDAGTSVRVNRTGATDPGRVEVLSGSALIASVHGSPLVTCDSEVTLSDAGWFRFDVQRADVDGTRPCSVRIFDGAAIVPLLTVSNHLRTGQTMMCDRRCGDMIATREFSRDQLDDFNRWARRMQQEFGR